MLRSRAPTLPEYRVRNDYEKARQPHHRLRFRVFSDPRVILAMKVSAGAMLFALLWILYSWEVHIEIMFYARSWVRQEVLPIEPLAGCFSEEHIRADGSLYNLTKARAPKQYEVHAGVEMRLGMDCYDFAGTIPPPHVASRPSSPLPAAQRTNFHTYWRADLIPFGERQEWMLRSFFATQDLMSSRLILWTNGLSLASHPRVMGYLRMHSGAFEVRLVDVVGLAKGTPLEDSPRLHSSDSKAWVDGDLLRLLVIWVHGGVWVDMDSLLTRDLKPLLEHEFVSEWDCYSEFI
jgi:Glycosyltransferase sugar-binding region containing DXD motif